MAAGVMCGMSMGTFVSRERKIIQETVEECLDRVDAIKVLYEIKFITLHDYWLLIGNYKIER